MKVWPVLLSQKWLRVGERGWIKGEVTLPPLNSFIPRPPHSENYIKMEAASQGTLFVKTQINPN